MPQAQVVIWSLAFLATPGLILPVRFATSQLRIDEDPATIAHALLVFRLFFITLTMTAVGIVALVIWDGIFPDRRDARILTPLPVPGSVLIGARLLALGALCGIFVVGINAVPTVFCAPMIAAFGGAANQVQGILAFVVANGLAGLFVFSTLISLQGLALNLGGKRATDRMSLLLQVLFVMALLQMIFFMTRVGAVLPTDLNSGWLRAMPSVWFLGLYDVIGGRPATGAPMLAVAALLATGTTVGGAILLFVSTHARLTRRALESREIEAPGRSATITGASLTRGICRHPVAQGVFDFTLKSLARSRSHRLLMAIYIGVALALVASAIVPVAIRDGLAGFAVPGVELLSAPFVIGFFSLVGMRVAVAIPIEPKANWLFRLCEPSDRAAAMVGVRNAMLLVGVVPTSLIALVTALALWGVWPALVHAGICALMGWLLVEILMIGLSKLPFTCTYFPGSSRVGTLWPLYLTGFVTYSYTVAAWEDRFFKQPVDLVVFTVVIGSAIAVLSLRRRRHLAELSGLLYDEEDPAAIFEGFNLSEGLAARAARGSATIDR
jgi:hypothetical protein